MRLGRSIMMKNSKRLMVLMILAWMWRMTRHACNESWIHENEKISCLYFKVRLCFPVPTRRFTSTGTNPLKALLSWK